VHQPAALSWFDFQVVKIGTGSPPIRIPEGWLLIHHGVSGRLLPENQPATVRELCGRAIVLSADDPTVVLACSSEPLLSAELAGDRHGIVPNVVFPTATDEIDGNLFAFHGMADSRIGVARLDRTGDPV